MPKLNLEAYDYSLPADLVAASPAEPRDSARLFAYDAKSGKVSYDTVANLADKLPAGALLIMNDTKVLPARVDATKETGGRVELLLLVNEYAGTGTLRGISDRKIVPGQKLYLDPSHALVVVGQEENIFLFEPQFPPSELPALLMEIGRTPLPKYIGETGMDESALRERYQTVFAKSPASVAAPTASLHFTEKVFESLAKKNIDVAFLTLHVGMGTFAPVRPENIEQGKLHEEWYEVTEATARKIRDSKKEGRPVIAVGTTVLRTIESAAGSIMEGKGAKGKTDIFIYPPYAFKVADGLMTNFHVPKSSLMCIVDAFLGFKKSPKGIVELYGDAIRERFRFYSFGDSMLIL
jgi:S-adenosylmethionine:tRNA ribosyltransferase-isomerase